MAESSVSLAQDQFSCSICLDLLKNPVAIPCGHSYCMSCITGCWDQDDQKGVYSCPQCRQTFTPRPVLGKNTMLAEVVEKLKKTKQAAHPAQCYTGSGDVECDVCTEDKNKAIKSCLVCLNSYCQNHLEQHENLFKGKRHNLMDATGRLQEMICPRHEKLLEIYCRTDQNCICYPCMIDEHRNHEIVSAAAERTEKQRQLEETQRTNQQRIQERQKELEELREAVESHKCSAQAAVKDSEMNFTELIRSIERSCSEVTQLIRDQEKAAVSRAEGRLEQLEQEIDDLRKRDAELEQLSHTDNHIHFLQSFQSLSVPPGSTDSPSITVSSRLSFDDVGKSVSHLREKLEHFCRDEIEKISGKLIEIFPTPEPKTTENCLQYSHQFTQGIYEENKHICSIERNRVFGSAPTQNEGEEIHNKGDKEMDIHFEPSVSLPKVEVKSGEEDEKILFKEKTKLYRWDSDNRYWKEHGIGNINILFHPLKKTYRVLMQRDQVLKVCVNHPITKNIELKPMTTAANTLMWTATDFSEGDGKVEQLAVKFRTPELAKSFRYAFTDCQSRMLQVESSPLPIAEGLSQDTNPAVYFTIAADEEPIGRIVMELFAHIVPQTAENFRALCTGEKGFGYRRSIFHRIIPDFICQGGDITNSDGTGGKSIYLRNFEDENFNVRHKWPGLLSMANRGRDNNSSQFFFTLKKAEHLDFRHVVFGFVKDGMNVVKKMGKLGTKDGKPTKKITIIDCGQL